MIQSSLEEIQSTYPHNNVPQIVHVEKETMSADYTVVDQTRRHLISILSNGLSTRRIKSGFPMYSLIDGQASRPFWRGILWFFLGQYNRGLLDILSIAICPSGDMISRCFEDNHMRAILRESTLDILTLVIP